MCGGGGFSFVGLDQTFENERTTIRKSFEKTQKHISGIQGGSKSTGNSISRNLNLLKVSLVQSDSNFLDCWNPVPWFRPCGFPKFDFCCSNFLDCWIPVPWFRRCDRKDGGFRRTCAADPWIGDDDDFLVGAHRRGTGTEPVTRL